MSDPFQLDETANSVSNLASAVDTMNQRQPDGPSKTYIGPMKEVVVQARQGQKPGMDTPQAAKVATPTDAKVTGVRGTQFNPNKSAANTTPSNTPSSDAGEDTSRRFSR